MACLIIPNLEVSDASRAEWLAYYTDRNYYEIFREFLTGKGFVGKVLLVGIIYDKEAADELRKHHTCVIEEVHGF